ncbi:MAG: hypothetical protein JOZ19_12155, partial [Rubrobacter sp.]|nr:hypothetical protein [Rubrobacter sp.]
RHEPGTAPDGTEMDVPFYTMNYDIVLVPYEEDPSGDGAARTTRTTEE